MDVKIVYGVPIYTMDSERSKREALVVVNEKIELVGSMGEAFSLYPGGERVRLEKGCILPGFIDAHLHLKEYSLLYRDLDLSNISSQMEVLEKIREIASSKREGEWIQAVGCNFLILSEITRYDLDSASPHNPLVIYSRDLHSALANSMALSLAEIDEHSGDPYGGKIVRDERGNLTGLLQERALELVKNKIPDERSRRLDSIIEKGVHRLLANGVTGFCDCSVGSMDSSIKYLMRLWKNEKLNARMVLMLSEKEVLNLGEVGIFSLFGNPFLKIGGLKLVIDGSLSSLTGYMSKPYVGGGNCGMLLIDEDELYTLLRESYSRYIWAAIHAIGDRANEIALNVFERISRDKGIPRLLKRVEHAQTLKDEDVRRFSELGVIAVVNPSHIPLDRSRAIRNLGAEAKLMHRFSGLLSSGAVIGIGSDAPVGLINPLYGLYCAVERKDFDDGPEMRFYPKERITLQDAVFAYTMGGAIAIGMEKDLGSIEKGKFADFVNLSKDIFECGIEDLKTTEVLKTMVGGKVVYSKEGK